LTILTRTTLQGASGFAVALLVFLILTGLVFDLQTGFERNLALTGTLDDQFLTLFEESSNIQESTQLILRERDADKIEALVVAVQASEDAIEGVLKGPTFSASKAPEF